ncbi:hypothetical protein SDJN03_09258, partial [Cucurbita argyrosperma subsp. sororia]
MPAQVDEETQARVTAHADEEAQALAKIGPIENSPKVDEETLARARAETPKPMRNLRSQSMKKLRPESKQAHVDQETEPISERAHPHVES